LKYPLKIFWPIFVRWISTPQQLKAAANRLKGGKKKRAKQTIFLPDFFPLRSSSSLSFYSSSFSLF
jgi:hypothetical protein